MHESRINPPWTVRRSAPSAISNRSIQIWRLLWRTEVRCGRLQRIELTFSIASKKSLAVVQSLTSIESSNSELFWFHCQDQGPCSSLLLSLSSKELRRFISWDFLWISIEVFGARMGLGRFLEKWGLQRPFVPRFGVVSVNKALSLCFDLNYRACSGLLKARRWRHALHSLALEIL